MSNSRTSASRRIGKFEVTAEIGENTFGKVYRGRDPVLGREVLLKVCTAVDRELRQRFYREAELVARLRHDGIAPIVDYGFTEESPYLAQEALEGRELQSLLAARTPLALDEKLDVLLQITAALGYAHSQGVVHRGVRPANVWLLDGGAVKVSDFGLAQLTGTDAQSAQNGVNEGVVGYQPPEQVRGGEGDERADVFSFGVLAYELLSGERPFRGNTPSALVYQILYKPPVPITTVWSTCPEALARLIARCLEKDPAQRYPDFSAIASELETIRRDFAADRATPEAATEPPKGAAAQVGTETVRLGTETIRISAVPPMPPPASPPPSPSSSAPVAKPRQPKAEKPKRKGADDREATQPIPIIPPTDPATRKMALPAAPRADDLSSAAQTIRSLVEQGDLEAARAQLEKTIERQGTGAVPVLDPTPSESARAAESAHSTVRIPQLRVPEQTAPPPVEPAPAKPVVGVLSTAMTQRLPPVPPAAESVAAEEIPTTKVPAPVAPPSTAPPPVAPPSTASPPPPVAPPPGVLPTLEAAPLNRPETATSSRSGSTPTAPRPAATAPRPRWLLGVGAAAGVAALLLVGWLTFRGVGSERTAEPPIAPVVETPTTEVPAAPVETGAVAVNALPWAEVMEITDAQGYVQEVPAERRTPLLLRLPPGEYRLTLRHPERSGVATCEAVVLAGGLETCTATFEKAPPAPTATQYFKENGWWQ